MERRFRITVDGTPYDVTVEDLTDTGSKLYPQPGSMSLPAVPVPTPAASSPVAQPSPTAGAAAGPGDVVATLGGVVESVPVQAGQHVNAGDTVAVLEAMKMKSHMVAPRAGTIVSLAVKAGDAVEAGHVLATIG
jgi:glutaconyl-CoA/methylmalonyl-CoA decarboxylase subunit gamma